MARIDSLTILSDKQTIAGTEYSTKMIDVRAANDFGHGGLPQYVAIIAHGNYDLGATLEIQLQGCTEDDLSDAFIINTTGPLKAADLVEKWCTYLAIPPVGKKYKYMFLKYISDAGDSSSTHEDELCPTEPVLEVPDSQPNTFTAFLTLSIDSHMLTYPYANQDKETA